MQLTDAEIERYARQVVMPELGEEGKKKLLEANILILGAGGLGGPVIAGLAGAGIGHLTIIDEDVTEITNLNRQLIYSMDSLGEPKSENAAAFISRLNPEISVTCLTEKFEQNNAESLIKGQDLVIDCSDNVTSRFLVNEYCQKLHIPLIFGGAVRTDGQITTLHPSHENSPCLRCIFPHTELDYDQAPSCQTAGILGSTTMVIGALQVSEALKIIAGFGEPLIGRLLLYDGLANSFTEICVTKDPECPICSLR